MCELRSLGRMSQCSILRKYFNPGFMIALLELLITKAGTIKKQVKIAGGPGVSN
jgi:hypothetical protein